MDGATYKAISGEVLTSKNFTDYNSFDQPSKVKPVSFSNFKKESDKITAELPPLSVVVLTVKQLGGMISFQLYGQTYVSALTGEHIGSPLQLQIG